MKDFLLICDKNCITYKNVFPLIKDNKIRLGHNNIKEFVMNDGTSKLFGNIGWITTLHTPDKPKLVLTKTYNEKDYPRYDNYDAINVDRLKDIPYDYDGVMGVPITILEKDLDNVEIYKCLNDNTPETRVATINGKEKYARILMKIEGMAAGNSAVNGFGDDAGYTRHKEDRGGCPVKDNERIYTRVLIRRKGE